jgi:hypothetical protein
VFAVETELIGQTRRIFWLQFNVQGTVELKLLFMQLYKMPFSQVPEILFHNISTEVKMGLINKLNKCALLSRISKNRNCGMPLYSGLLGVERFEFC